MRRVLGAGAGALIGVTLLWATGCGGGTVSTDATGRNGGDTGASGGSGGTGGGGTEPVVVLSFGGGGRVRSTTFTMDVQFGHPFGHKPVSGQTTTVEGASPIK